MDNCKKYCQQYYRLNSTDKDWLEMKEAVMVYFQVLVSSI
jgi:hypothetical protein